MIEELLVRGGWILVAIVAASIASWTLIGLAWFIARDESRVDWDALDATIEGLSASPSGASAALAVHDGGVVGELLRRVGASLEGARAHLRDRRAFRLQADALLASRTASHEAYLRPVAVLATIMPLLGLLGTIVGVTISFEGIVSAPGARLEAMAGGVSRALITTEAGLVATLPVVLAHRALGSRLRRRRDAVLLRVQRIEAALCREEAS
ncbi:MAG: MotA/TolQ/ExbB proton channel family protein [Planctomycetota bacterium]